MKRRRQRSEPLKPVAGEVLSQHGELAAHYARHRARAAASMGSPDEAKQWCIVEGEIEARRIAEHQPGAD